MCKTPLIPFTMASSNLIMNITQPTSLRGHSSPRYTIPNIIFLIHSKLGMMGCHMEERIRVYNPCIVPWIGYQRCNKIHPHHPLEIFFINIIIIFLLILILLFHAVHYKIPDLAKIQTFFLELSRRFMSPTRFGSTILSLLSFLLLSSMNI